jgi:hypothetical protein
MPVTGKQRLCIQISTIVTFVTCLVLLSNGENLARYLNRVGQKATVPVISVQQQPEVPLRISILTYDSSDLRSPEIIYELTNISAKPIRAYVVNQDSFAAFLSFLLLIST